MNKLAVIRDGKTEFVFCRGRGFGGERNNLITTKTKTKALRPRDKAYFEEHFPHETFVVV